MATATLEPVNTIRSDEDTAVPSGTGGSGIVGAPFFRMIELPSLPGAENDPGPIAVVSADPWRVMQVRAGPSVDAFTVRADIERPATVGVLTSALASGPLYRWDEMSALTVRVEGRSPESRTNLAVLAGANLVAVETSVGWELIQYRKADLIGEDLWRLSGLLRGQQGTERATAMGAAVGAVVVLLDIAPARVLSPKAEHGAPLIWRAGPVGAPGGAGVSELHWTPTGAGDRPWSPVHLRTRETSDGGLDLTWIPRARLDGDRWDGDVVASDPMRFRLRILSGGDLMRTFEVEGDVATYAAATLAADFPEGIPSGVTVAVAQWGVGYGWGEEATFVL